MTSQNFSSEIFVNRNGNVVPLRCIEMQCQSVREDMASDSVKLAIWHPQIYDLSGLGDKL